MGLLASRYEGVETDQAPIPFCALPPQTVTNVPPTTTDLAREILALQDREQ